MAVGYTIVELQSKCLDIGHSIVGFVLECYLVHVLLYGFGYGVDILVWLNIGHLRHQLP